MALLCELKEEMPLTVSTPFPSSESHSLSCTASKLEFGLRERRVFCFVLCLQKSYLQFLPMLGAIQSFATLQIKFAQGWEASHENLCSVCTLRVAEDKMVTSTLSPSTWACREAAGWAVIVCVSVVAKKAPGSDECCHISCSSRTGMARLSCHCEVLLSHHSPPYFSLHFIQTSVR